MTASVLASELYAAIRILRSPPRTMPDAYAAIILDWFLTCHDDLSSASQSADVHHVDPLSLVDEPDSVRRALTLARAVIEENR